MATVLSRVPVDGSLPGSPVHGCLQARSLEWVAISSSGRASTPGDHTRVSCMTVRRTVSH